MESKTNQSHIFFFPYMAHGHMIPALDMAKLFASRGIKTTIISTPVNIAFFSTEIERSKLSGYDINVIVLKFPFVEVGLPQGCESAHMVETSEDLQKFLTATTLLEQQLEQLLKEHKPNCLIADWFFPWTTSVAAKFGIPRLVFHGVNFISICISQHLLKLDLSVLISADSKPLVISELPNEIKLPGSQIADFIKAKTKFRAFSEWAVETERKSYGVIVNSFYELEPAYADHYRNFLGIKAWHIGPTFLINKATNPCIDERECLKWLNFKKPNSVIYLSFGSVIKFDDAQLMEIATGLEASGQQFIWVVKKDVQEFKETWLPEGFENRVENRGLVIRGWAPQVHILKHVAVGGFVTHCGWNSVIEAVSAGVPMVTWPAFADQFYNEKLVTQILGIGIGVGISKWARFGGEMVKSGVIENVAREIMEGKEAEEMRNRATKLGELARKSFEEGGSSHKDLNCLIEDLRLHATAPSP